MFKPKEYKFVNPDPNFKAPNTTSSATFYEALLSEIYDPIDPDEGKNTAGLMIRAAVDRARYERSANANPKERARYERLGEATLVMCQKRLDRVREEGGDEMVEIIKKRLSEIDCTQLDYVPYIAPEKDGDIEFRFNPSYQVWYENGGMKDVPMLPGEESEASFRCNGGPHKEDQAGLFAL